MWVTLCQSRDSLVRAVLEEVSEQLQGVDTNHLGPRTEQLEDNRDSVLLVKHRCHCGAVFAEHRHEELKNVENIFILSREEED